MLTCERDDQAMNDSNKWTVIGVLGGGFLFVCWMLGMMWMDLEKSRIKAASESKVETTP